MGDDSETCLVLDAQMTDQSTRGVSRSFPNLPCAFVDSPSQTDIVGMRVLGRRSSYLEGTRLRTSWRGEGSRRI